MCKDSRVHTAGSEPGCILMQGLARQADSVSSCFLLCCVFYFENKEKEMREEEKEVKWDTGIDVIPSRNI